MDPVNINQSLDLQSWQQYLMQLWWQMPEPPHILHTLLRRLCSHIDIYIASALDTVVVADTGTPAYLALAPYAVMLAYLRSATLLALVLLTVVVADAGAPAYLAHTPLAVMLADLRSATLLAHIYIVFPLQDGIE
jgi:hypothetical protein